MADIDKVIEKHGGWPGAFATASGTASTVREETLAYAAEEQAP